MIYDNCNNDKNNNNHHHHHNNNVNNNNTHNYNPNEDDYDDDVKTIRLLFFLFSTQPPLTQPKYTWELGLILNWLTPKSNWNIQILATGRGALGCSLPPPQKKKKREEEEEEKEKEEKEMMKMQYFLHKNS